MKEVSSLTVTSWSTSPSNEAFKLLTVAPVTRWAPPTMHHSVTVDCLNLLINTRKSCEYVIQGTSWKRLFFISCFSEESSTKLRYTHSSFITLPSLGSDFSNKKRSNASHGAFCCLS